jgi:2-dehydropantoate 2-reductase
MTGPKPPKRQVAHLTDEFYELIRPDHTPTPNMDRLAESTYGRKEPLPKGSKNIPLRWDAVYGAAVLPDL